MIFRRNLKLKLKRHSLLLLLIAAIAVPITGFSITSNVVTILAANNFVSGEQVQIS